MTDEFNNSTLMDDQPDAPPPNPRFVRELRGNLMLRATEMANARALTNPQPWNGRGSTAARPQPRRWDRSLTYQLMAVALLLVAMLASLAYGGRNSPVTPATPANNAVIPALQDDPPAVAMYMENAARTGISIGTGPLTTPEIAWSQPGQFTGSSLYADGVIYQKTMDTDPVGTPHIEARSAATGEILWRVQTDWYSSAELLVADNRVYFAAMFDEDGDQLTALNAATGQQEWSVSTGVSTYSSLAYEDGVIYLLALSEDYKLLAIDSITGNIDWTLDIETMSRDTTGNELVDDWSGYMSQFTPAVVNGVAYITAGDGAVYALDVASRKVLWWYQTEGNYLDTPVVANGHVYATTCAMQDNGTAGKPSADQCWMYMLDAESGALLKSVSQPVSILAVTEEVVLAYLGSGVGLLSAETLEPIGSPVENWWGLGSITPDTIFSGDIDGILTATRYGAKDGFTVLWSVYTGSSGGGGMLAGDLLIIPGADFSNTIVALKSSSGTPVAGSEPVDLSGLPPCLPPPAIDWKALTGEPANTITDQTATGTGVVNGEYTAVIDDTPREGTQPWMSLEDVPAGDPVSAAAQDGIRATIDAMIDCMKPGPKDITGFFSEDFFRRSWIREALVNLNVAYPGHDDQVLLSAVWAPLTDEYVSATLLPDGRVAVIVDPQLNNPIEDDFRVFVVFVEQDGRWVVDEAIRVGLWALMG
jgi:outer membrane protein assembly factor BamB